MDKNGIAFLLFFYLICLDLHTNYLMPMKKSHSFYLFLLLISLTLFNCQSPSGTEIVYDFKDTLWQQEGWTFRVKPAMILDSTERVNGKYPLKIKSVTHPELHYEIPLAGSFYKQIIVSDLAEENSETATFCIRNKALRMDRFFVKFYCLNKEDKVVFCDSMNIKLENSWTTTTFSFPLYHTQKIVLGIVALGVDYPSPLAGQPQGLWLDKLTIRTSAGKLGNDDPEKLAIHEPLDTIQLTQIDAPFDLKPEQIHLPGDKRIIGIGEAVRGSKTIQQMELGLIRNLILNHSCKLVLLEGELSQCMRWNQYVQGILHQDSIQDLKKDFISTLYSPEEFGDFLVWLREYNRTAPEKVTIRGLLSFNFRADSQLFHYLHAYYKPSTASVIYPLLEELFLSAGLPDALSQAEERKSSLQTIMGPQEYDTFIYALKKTIYSQSVHQNATFFFYSLLYREAAMAETAIHWMDRFLKDNQKACILGHMGQVNKRVSPTFPDLLSMGYYLQQKYGESYYALGVFPGKGNTSAIQEDFFLVPSELQPLLDNSVEDACIQTGIPVFFYPTHALRNELSYFRFMGYNWVENKYVSGNLRTQMDGFLFVDKIDPIHFTTLEPNEVKRGGENARRQYFILTDLKNKTGYIRESN